MSRETTPAQYRKWRFYAESLIQQAIDILDALDGDPDLEETGDDEPSLASPVGGESQLCWSAGCDDDREKPSARFRKLVYRKMTMTDDPQIRNRQRC